jgi:hypothetical protein
MRVRFHLRHLSWLGAVAALGVAACAAEVSDEELAEAGDISGFVDEAKGPGERVARRRESPRDLAAFCRIHGAHAREIEAMRRDIDLAGMGHHAGPMGRVGFLPDPIDCDELEEEAEDEAGKAARRREGHTRAGRQRD